jgi:hypothetical protein
MGIVHQPAGLVPENAVVGQRLPGFFVAPDQQSQGHFHLLVYECPDREAFKCGIDYSMPTCYFVKTSTFL